MSELLTRVARETKRVVARSRWWAASARWRDNFRYFLGAFVLGVTRGSATADAQVRLALFRLAGGGLAAASLLHPRTAEPRTGLRFRYYALQKFRVLVVHGASGVVDAPAGALPFLADRAEARLVRARDFDRGRPPPARDAPKLLREERLRVMCLENAGGGWGYALALMRADGELRTEVAEIREALGFISGGGAAGAAG